MLEENWIANSVLCSLHSYQGENQIMFCSSIGIRPGEGKKNLRALSHVTLRTYVI